MTSQYVFPSKLGMFRIVQHGRRWRALHDRVECGRHDSAEAALVTLRAVWPQARLPGQLDAWRQSEMIRVRLPAPPMPRWNTAY
jgi:hypothetical protein